MIIVINALCQFLARRIKKRNIRQVVRSYKVIHDILYTVEKYKAYLYDRQIKANICYIKDSKTNTTIYCKEQASFSRVFCFCFCFSIVSYTVAVSYSSFYMNRVRVRIWKGINGSLLEYFQNPIENSQNEATQQKHDRLFSFLEIGTSMKSAGVKLVLFAQTSTLSEMMRSCRRA